MKKKTMIITFFVELVILIIASLMHIKGNDLIDGVFCYPLEKIASSLEHLSKTGALGNGMAIALWVGISLIPILASFYYPRGKKAYAERVILYVLSAMILFAIYAMINVKKLSPIYLDDYSIVKKTISVSLWAVVLLYVVAVLIRLLKNSDKAHLSKYLQWFLYFMYIIIIAQAYNNIVGAFVPDMIMARFFLDRYFNAFRVVVEIIPMVLELELIVRIIDLIKLSQDDNQGKITTAAKRLSNICCLTLGVTVAMTVIYNVAQILAMSRLINVSVNIYNPLLSIAFVAMILFFIRVIVENKELHDDNSLFI